MGNVTPPTRHPKWVSSGGVTLRDCLWDSLTFSFSELTPAFICTNSVITKIIFIHKRTTTEVVSIVNKNSFTYIHIHTTIVTFIIFYTHILESLYLYYYNSLLQNYTYKIRDFGSSASEHLSLKWPALLMWDVLSSILVFWFCTYTD